MNKKPLTPTQQDIINQVAASMAIENMPLTDEACENLQAMASGEKTIEQVIIELKKKYYHDK